MIHAVDEKHNSSGQHLAYLAAQTWTIDDLRVTFGSISEMHGSYK